MATKEKWIDLFEKAVGRPPHALEIEEGQKADFDLKAIKGIAAMGLDQEATPSEPPEEVDEYIGIYSVEVTVEKIRRKTDLYIEPATCETILRERHFGVRPAYNKLH